MPEGLPQSSVSSLSQGPEGWLLAGTQEGIARFDGFSWEALPFESSTTSPCRPIRSLARGAHEVWVGTAHCGLFELSNGVVRRVAEMDSPSVVGLHVDPDGTLWVATSRSVSRRLPDGRSEVLLKGESVRALQVTGEGFWVAFDGHLRFVPTRGAAVDVPELEGKAIQVLASSGETLWVGTAHDGLFEVHDLHAQKRPGPATVSALLVDRSGTLWVGDRDGGLLRAGENGLQPVHGFEGVPPISLLEDQEGSIWVGTSTHGVHQLRPAQIENLGEQEGLANPVSWSVAQDGKGTIWIGTESGRLLYLANGRPVAIELPPSLKGAAVFDLSSAPDGTLWLSTRKGFAVKRGETITPLGEADGLHPEAGSILVRKDGTVWAGDPTGLYRSTGGRFERVTAIPAGLQVHALRETSDGALWVGTENGLFVLRRGVVRRYTEKDGLSGDRILEVTEDANRPGTVWVGGSDGISLVEPAEIHTLRGAQGLTDELDFQIVDDGLGHLWLGTNHGIIRIEKQQVDELFAGRRQRIEPLEFGVADGMRNPECNGYSTSSAIRTRDGQLWFATMGGAVHFFPDRLQPSIPTAPISIIAASSNGDALVEGGKIQPRDPNVEIRYVAPTFLDPARLSYRYRLDGFDANWVEVGHRRHALYTNLPPGTFTFRVQAYLPGEWYSDEARFSFVRPTRLTEHWSFWFCTALLALLLFGGVAFLHMRRLEQRVRERTRELSEALERVAQSERSVRIAERMASIGTLAAGVAHEINNPLAYLCANVDFALQELRDASVPLFAERVGEIISALTEASDGAQRVKTIVKDLKTFSRAEDGPPGSVDVQQVFDTALNLSRNTIIQRARLTVDLHPVPPVRGEAGRLAQVLVNLLINAAQAIPTGATDRNEILARCRSAEDGWIIAEVRDSGSGIAPENLQRIFDPFFTTKPVGVGTGLGLSICHGIVSAMGGKIQVESVVGQGTTFRVRLPPSADTQDPVKGAPAPARVLGKATPIGRVKPVRPPTPSLG